MMWVGLRPDVYMFPCVLQICGGVPDWMTRREVYDHVLNALMTMYVKCEDVVCVRKVFENMVTMDCISWKMKVA